MNSERLIQALHTRFEIPVNPTFDLNTRFFFTGSCFSENIGNQLNELGFETNINPFGILFNPVSIANALAAIEAEKVYSEVDLYYQNGNFISLDHHGSFKNQSAENLLIEINSKIKQSKEFITTCNCAIITLGSAFVYIHNSDKLVANCHKIPDTEFTKLLLNDAEIIGALQKMIASLLAINPEVEIIFTISPVKHLRDGVLENAISKGRLLSAVDAFIKENNNEKISYFPSNEIVTEELRDHRFYAEDLAHPTLWTIMYIFNRFVNCKMNERAKEFIESTLKYVRMKNHRLISKNPDEILIWGRKMEETLEKIKSTFPEKIWP